MNTLSFVDDVVFSNLVDEVIEKFANARASAVRNFYSNSIDPFSAVFEAALNGISVEDWFEMETTRQIQKTLNNAVGTFHQKLLGSLEGWVDFGVGSGIDLRSARHKIVAEVKNKHNTMNSSSAEATFEKLSNWLRYRDKGFTAYVVTIVPKTPEPLDRAWTHSASIAPARPDIRIIDGRSFYALATGDSNALFKVYEKLQTSLIEKMSDANESISYDPLAKKIFARTFG